MKREKTEEKSSKSFVRTSEIKKLSKKEGILRRPNCPGIPEREGIALKARIREGQPRYR